MVKVVGPLFSLSASGTYRKAMVFRTRAGSTYVASLPSSLPERSAGQLANAQKIRDLSTAWTDLAQPTKDVWIACGVTLGKVAYHIWWEQWFIQGSSPGNNPVSPC